MMKDHGKGDRNGGRWGWKYRDKPTKTWKKNLSMSLSSMIKSISEIFNKIPSMARNMKSCLQSPL